MSYNYVLSNLAEQDIEDIVNYIMKDGLKVANLFVDSLYDALQKLSDYPGIGHKREDLTDHPVKFWTFKWRYLIVYCDSDPFKIVRVLNYYRDILNLL